MKVYAKLSVVEKVENEHEEISFARAKKFKNDVQLGEDLEVPVTPRDFGRIAAQTAKQAMMERIRQAEKEMIDDEFNDRAGEIVSGGVHGRTLRAPRCGRRPRQSLEAVMPNKERVQTEDYNVSDRLRAYVVAVQNGARGPEIIISRSHPNFVRRLFETEVMVDRRPHGRDQGHRLAKREHRTKIAVWTATRRSTPVGACVGTCAARG